MLAAETGGQPSDGPMVAIRAKRQTTDNQRPSVGLGSQSSASASANAVSSASTSGAQLGVDQARPQSGTLNNSDRPRRPKVTPAGSASASANSDSLNDEIIDDEDRPPRTRKPKRVRRPARRRLERYDEETTDDDYEDCHDDYDYGHPMAFHEAATRPMRHFNRMMEGMFSKMRDLAAGGKFRANNENDCQ